MSKDDYFVLAYKLLRYLYRCLKEGTPASWDIIAPNTENFPVSQQYFTYLISHLLADGYIEGIVEMKAKAIGALVQFKETTGLAITPKGIAYLEENSTMKRVQEFLGPTGEIANMVISRFM